MRKALTDKTLSALKPEPRRYEVRDARLPGFAVRVFPTGQKTFTVSYRYGTKQRRMTLGRYPIISLSEAREKAVQALRHVDTGTDPTRVQRVRSYLVCNVLDEFTEKYAKQKTRSWKPVHALLLREIVGPYGQRDIRQLERSDIVAVLDDMVTRGLTTQANRTLAHVRKMLNWCVERGILNTSPASGIKAPCKETPRERVLSDDEIRRIMPVCKVHGFPFGDAIRIMLLTAQRRGEVAGMRWSELDLENRVWHLPSHRTKNGRPHVVPLSPPVIEILENLPRFARSDLVFTTTGKTGVSGWGKVVDRLNDEAGVHDWRLHDLRRTAASGMARLSIAPHVIEKVLNHISGTISGVAAVYNRYGYDAEKYEALDKWGVFVAGLQENSTGVVR